MFENKNHFLGVYVFYYLPSFYKKFKLLIIPNGTPSPEEGAQWLSGRVLNSRQGGCGFKPHRRHRVVVLEQDTFILA